MKKFTSLLILFGALSLGTGLMAQGVAGGPTDSDPDNDPGAMASDAGHSSATGGNNSHLLLEDDGRVYPNPAVDGKFTIELPAPSDHIEVFNTLGQLVTPLYTPRNGGRTVQVDMNGHTPGIYFVRISSGGHTTIKRVVVR